MDSKEKQLNRDLIIGWTVIVLVLFVAYLGEVLKGERTIAYVMVFMFATGIPALTCWLIYRRNPLCHSLRYCIVIGYFVMYLFVLASANTILVFTYILPLLSFLILYHQPRLILGTGAAALAVNLAAIVWRALRHEITLENSRDVEIQVALLTLCFAGSFVASRLYNAIDTQNREYVAMLDEKSNQIQRMTFQTIETIANTIDAKDDYTQGHSRRVSDYSAQIAKRIGMSEAEIMNVRYIALLHDIGKIGVPDAVLNKPGKLTDAEYELMKRHTTIGGEILKDIGILEGLEVGAKYHHERYDGKGYPNGLKGDEIPLIARIIGLADAYDAMSSNRVYRRQLAREKVMEEISRCRGTQFDPEITDAFLEYLEHDMPWQWQRNIDDHEMLAGAGNKLLQRIMTTQVSPGENSEWDEITMVYKRSAGEHYIAEQLKQSQSRGALLLVSVEKMHHINQQYGFRRGDYHLQTLAGILRVMSKETIICRFRGNEFLCYVPDKSGTEEIQRMVEKVLEEAKRCEREDELIERFILAIGITRHDRDGQDLSLLLLEADRALYHVKQLPGTNYYFYRSLDESGDEVSRVDLENIVAALTSGEKDAGVNVVQQDDFVRMKEFIVRMAENGSDKIQVVMFTAKTKDEGRMTVAEREGAMKLLDRSIYAVLQDRGIVVRYSGMQRIFMQDGAKQGDADWTVEEIMMYFYRSYGKSDMELFYDMAEIAADCGLDKMHKN